MRDTFLRAPDVVFINKRFTQNRFKRPLLMFFTVTNSGKSQLLGFSLVEKEEQNFFSKSVSAFMKHMNGIKPRTVIIERHLKLFQSFKEIMPETQVLFCYFHIQKTLKQHFSFMEKDQLQEYQKIQDLPMIENMAEFDSYLEDVNNISFDNDYFKLIIQKLMNERMLWPKWAHIQNFTGGISVCQRNEHIKSYLKATLKRRDCTIAELVKRLQSIENRDFKQSNEYQKVSQKHDPVFRHALFLNTTVKENFSQYAYLRIKWNFARGFRWEIVEGGDDGQYVIKMKNQNILSKKPWQLSQVIVSITKGKAVCECSEALHSGFPCPHLCLLNFKGKLPSLEIHPRWRKSPREKSAMKTGQKGLNDVITVPNNTQMSVYPNFTQVQSVMPGMTQMTERNPKPSQDGECLEL